jgi:hypothetical protein
VAIAYKCIRKKEIVLFILGALTALFVADTVLTVFSLHLSFIDTYVPYLCYLSVEVNTTFVAVFNLTITCLRIRNGDLLILWYLSR